MKRSSNSRVWKPARTNMAISASLWPLRCSASISSPTQRASSSASHTPRSVTFSPSFTSVHSVLPRRPSFCAMRAEEAQPEILRDVGVLVLVDQEVAEAPLILLEHLAVLSEERQIVQRQIAEIDGVEG